MPQNVSLLRVFVASPGDVVKERRRLASVVAELNRTIAIEHNARIELVRWETHARPGFGADAQDVINRQLPPIDIFIGVFWNRFGTPTSRAGSGTAEEFELAYRAFKREGMPSIMVYFRDPGPLEEATPDELAQRAKVAEFRDYVTSLGALYRSYSRSSQFEQLVREHLVAELPNVMARTRTPAVEDRWVRTMAPVSETTTVRLRERAGAWETLCESFIPAVHHLIRLADDLRLASDYYLATTPNSIDVFRTQTKDMSDVIQTYNAAWERIYQERFDYEGMFEVLGQLALDDIRSLAVPVLMAALDFPRGYEPPEAGRDRGYKKRYTELDLRWRAERTRLTAKLQLARAEMSQLEDALEREARALGERAPHVDTDAAWEAAGLLLDYRAQTLALGKAIRGFLQNEFESAKQAETAAWSLLAPTITSLNGAYAAIEKRSTTLVFALLRGASSDFDHGHLANALKRSHIFQWHEVVPQLNVLLLNIIRLTHGDPDPALLQAIKLESRQWTQLIDILENRSRVFDVSEQADSLVRSAPSAAVSHVN